MGSGAAYPQSSRESGASDGARNSAQIEKYVVAIGDAFGERHARYAGALDDLAQARLREGRLREAEDAARRALAIRQSPPSPDRPELAQSLNTLGLIEAALGKTVDARAALEQALALREAALPADHPDIAVSLTNLAALYQSQGQTARAERLFRRALDMEERAPPQERAALSQTLNNLAFLYKETGRLDEAERLYERALALRLAARPDGDPSVATSLNNLGMLHLSRGRDEDAERMLTRALALREKFLPDDHPDLAATCANLAKALERRGKPGERAPAADPTTLAVRLDQLGGLYLKQNRLADAETALTRALRLSVTALGPGDPSVMARSMRLADLYLKQGKRPPGGGEDLAPLKMTVKLAPLALRARSAERAR
jgi:tetratricopeptide (TPR) repeat protein